MFEKRSLDLEAARKAIEASINSADQPIAVAVADDNGELVHALRMDGATAQDMRQAVRKAYTAAFMGRDTRAYRHQLLEDGRTLADWSDAMLTTLTGGLTVRVDAQVIGGIGVHGNAAERDEELARIGLEAMGLAAGPRPEGARVG